ncbi:2Fe-2S iron-sulfur cluster-binding protein [Streptomyces violaceusniger]|uniref:(2Fe-2S)-binding domain-containing protein n=1 Tax=Streptomyces violaceusniger (strain Tu 4113) TaxID=653045 RepID=G2P2J5_STRV4|nr:(2Fe-2S)-binding domain-containing protein [Streptomyces violaceusniger Tu 4113]
MRVNITVNGRPYEADDVWEGESLLYVLRERMGLPGSKNACEQGECGSCTVRLDGVPVCACLVAAGQAEGREVVTVEGLADHARQRSAYAAGAVRPGEPRTGRSGEPEVRPAEPDAVRSGEPGPGHPVEPEAVRSGEPGPGRPAEPEAAHPGKPEVGHPVGPEAVRPRPPEPSRPEPSRPEPSRPEPSRPEPSRPGQVAPLAPVQQAFIDAGAVQCGFCTPGLLVAADELLERTPDPSDADIREALSGNLCRCTGYEMILDAVRLAAARTGKAV